MSRDPLDHAPLWLRVLTAAILWLSEPKRRPRA